MDPITCAALVGLSMPAVPPVANRVAIEEAVTVSSVSSTDATFVCHCPLCMAAAQVGIPPAHG